MLQTWARTQKNPRALYEPQRVTLLAAGCVILFATALNEFIITLLQYADFSGLLGGMTLQGSVIFNHVIINAFRAAGFLLVMIGIFQVLSSKTTQRK